MKKEREQFIRRDALIIFANNARLQQSTLWYYDINFVILSSLVNSFSMDIYIVSIALTFVGFRLYGVGDRFIFTSEVAKGHVHCIRLDFTPFLLI